MMEYQIKSFIKFRVVETVRVGRSLFTAERLMDNGEWVDINAKGCNIFETKEAAEFSIDVAYNNIHVATLYHDYDPSKK